MVKLLTFVATALATAGVAIAQTPQPQPPTESTFLPLPPESEADRAAVIDRLATELEENFVLPEVARRYAQALRAKAANGGYDNLGARFAETIQNDLQAIHPDRHLRVGRTGEARSGSGPVMVPGRVVRTPGSGEAPADAGAPRRMMRMPDPSTAIGRSGWIADGVAYIELNLFPGAPETVERIGTLLDGYRSARALILDIRNHRGGGPAEMNAIFSRIFARETPLVGMDTRLAVDQRQSVPIRDAATMRRVPGPEGVARRIHYAVPSGPDSPLRHAQIFVLTSHRSGSAAEHFALALKRTGRATVIGETTAGAGHYGAPVDLGHGYTAFIPFGRSFDPDNDRGWEGVGVAPNVAVPADQALDEALRRAGVAPGQRRTIASAG
jgi:hypothetical protein